MKYVYINDSLSITLYGLYRKLPLISTWLVQLLKGFLDGLSSVVIYSRKLIGGSKTSFENESQLC